MSDVFKMLCQGVLSVLCCYIVAKVLKVSHSMLLSLTKINHGFIIVV